MLLISQISLQAFGSENCVKSCLAATQCNRSAADHKRDAEKKIADAGSGTLVRNKAISKAYAEMYRSDPATFKWAGMAALASCKVGAGMKEARAAQSGWKKVAGSLVDIDGKELETALKTGNDAVFEDIYWQFEAYKTCGIAEIEKAFRAHELEEDAYQAWLNIDKGKKTHDETLIWQGNEMLLKHEQKKILQEKVYDKNRKLWKNVSDIGSRYQEIESPIPGDKSFQKFQKNRNIGNFDHRWNWIEDSMLPSWKEADKNPNEVLEKLKPCTD